MLFERLWLAGFGRYEVSKSGSLLQRSLIDASVFQPERLDFCGGASCGKGLEQRLPDPVLFNPDAGYLDTRASLPDLTADEVSQLEALRESLALPMADEQQRVRDAWVIQRVNERVAALPEPEQAAARPGLEKIYRQAVKGGRLDKDFEIVAKAKGAKAAKKITIAECLADKGKWHKATCLDPLEPDYPDGASRFVGWLNLKPGCLYITSQAHGGIKYRLDRDPDPVAEPDSQGDAPRCFVDGPDDLLVEGKSLLKHNDAAALLFEKEFGGRLFYDPVQLDWFEYQPDAGFFEKRPALAIEKAVYQAVNRHRGALGFDTSYVSGVTKCLLYEAVAQPKPVVGKICFTNGVLDLATRELLPHSPDFYFTSSLPFAWNPDAPEPEIFITWLRAAVGGHDDQVQLLRAYLNAVVVGRPELQRFLELVGAAGSGKGTFIRTAQALVGKGGSHPTRLKELEENRFETANLLGKRLVVIGDAEKWNGSIDVLKSITGQDSIRFEQKHKQGGEDFTFGGMVIIAGNQHTNSTDYSSGIQRRKITVPFDRVPPASERRDLDSEFEPLLPAILKWALDMPQSEVTARIRNTGAYTRSLRAAREEALAATNPLAAWMLDNVYFAENVLTQVGEKKRLTISSNDGYRETVSRTEYEHEETRLYPNYCRWCDQNSKNPLSKNLFSSTVIDVAKNLLNKSFVERIRDGAGARCIRGMTLTPPPRQPEPPPPADSQPTTSDNSRQPSDNLLTTQVIDSDEGIYLEPFYEVNNSVEEIAESESERAAFEAQEKNFSGDSGEQGGETALGCQVHQNQEVRLSEGCQKVVSGLSVGCQNLPADATDRALIAAATAKPQARKDLARTAGLFRAAACSDGREYAAGRFA